MGFLQLVSYCRFLKNKTGRNQSKNSAKASFIAQF